MILAAKLWLLSWFITEFKPIQDVLDKVIWKINNEKIRETILNVFGCKKCLSFWLILTFTLNPWIAIIGAIISQIYDVKIKFDI